MQKTPQKIEINPLWQMSEEEHVTLEDLIIDFYGLYFQEIRRNWQPQSETDWATFPVAGLEFFLNNGYRTVTKHLNKKQRVFIGHAITVLKENCVYLYAEYKQDPDYMQEIAQNSWTWIQNIKTKTRTGVRSGWDLNLAFWGIESFLMLRGKKFL
jgi:hypothetical protein